MILKSFLAALVLIGGLVLTAVAAAIGILMLLTRRLFGRRQASFSAPTPGRVRPSAGEIIEVSATELPADPPPR